MADIQYGPPMSPNASNATLPAARFNLQLPNQADQTPQITDRPPTDSDFLFQNALWRWKGYVYQQQNTVVGDPQWTLLNPYGSSLSGDAATVAPAGLWGLKQLKASYSGNLFIAQGADTTQVTVGQLSNGSADFRTMLATLGNDLPIRVAEVFDQSGNGYNLTQSTAANQPLLLIDRNGEPFVVFDAYEGAAGDTLYTRYLTIPSGLSLTKNTISAYNVEELRSLSGETGSPPNLLLIGSGGQNALQLVHYYNTGITIYGDGTGTSVSGGWHSAAQSISYLITSTSGRSAGVEGYVPYTKSGSLGTGTLTGGTLGMTSSTSFIAKSDGETAWRASMVFASTLSSANDLAVRAALAAQYSTRPQALSNIVLCGESVTEGFNAPGNISWAKLLQDSLPTSARIFNQGVGGEGVSLTNGSVTSMVSNYSGMIAPLYRVGAKANIAILFPGSNDGWNVSPNTPAQEMTAILQWVADAQGTGFTVFVCTLLDRVGTTAQAAYLAAMSPLIRSNAAAGSYTVIDVQAISSVGAPGAASNATNFPDGTHPASAAALASIASVIRAGIAPYVSP